MVIYLNDKFVPEKEAALHVGDLSIQRGFAVFDYFRTRKNIPLFLDDYLDRFSNSALNLGLQSVVSTEIIRNIIDEMIRVNNIPQSGFRMILTGGYSPDSFEPTTPNLVIIQQPIELPTIEKFDKGLAILLHEYMRDLPGIKSTNYLMGVWLQTKLKQADADEALYYKGESVLEFPRSNVFIVTKDDVVVTPKENVLMGITRKKILEVARNNYYVEERSISVDELKTAKEVFLTSTTKRILPVLKVDDIVVSKGKPGMVTRRLYRDFLELEDQYCGGSNS